jgi:hypothetical protein
VVNQAVDRGGGRELCYHAFGDYFLFGCKSTDCSGPVLFTTIGLANRCADDCQNGPLCGLGQVRPPIHHKSNIGC